MITVTGKLEDSSGNALHRAIVITSLSTPQTGAAGLVTGNTTENLMTDPTTGEFSVQLRPGLYSVSYKTVPKSTDFQIQVVGTAGSVSIDTLVVTPLPTLPGQAPYLVWNGERPGNITFQPIEDPAPPAVTVVAYAGSHITTETYTYAISYITPDGETAVSGVTSVTGDGTPNMANRVALEVGPTRVTVKRIWRNAGDSSELYLLAEVAPNVDHYDDWESTTDFDARKNALILAPAYNTTAGIINAQAGDPVLYFSISGLQVLAEASFTGTAVMASDFFLMPGMKLNFKDPDAGTRYGYLRDAGCYFIGGTGAPESGVWRADFFGITAQFWITAGELYFPQGAQAGYVLTSDANGKATWQAAAGGAAAVSIGALAAPAAPPANQAVISFAVGDSGSLFYWNPTTLDWVAIVS